MNCLENWFKYRMPGTSVAIGGSSHSTINGLAKGFVAAPFRNPAHGLFTIPMDFPLQEEEVAVHDSHIPDGTTRDEHRREVECIKAFLKSNPGKIVASRAIKIERRILLNDTFNTLCEAYPDAFVFMFSTPQTGTWIGATPELLLRKDGNRVMTMALAGTRHAGESGEWDIKNKEEQQMVTEHITQMLSDDCTTISYSHPHTLRAGNVEHICTDITATLSDKPHLEEILCRLSPTPAVCGSDRIESMRIIKETERHDREMYGGFCGPYELGGETAIFVNLRSAKCGDSAVCVYAGGGITLRSDADAEWEETEIKSKTIINKLKTSEV